jgi:hypothetical protein
MRIETERNSRPNGESVNKRPGDKEWHVLGMNGGEMVCGECHECHECSECSECSEVKCRDISRTSLTDRKPRTRMPPARFPATATDNPDNHPPAERECLVSRVNVDIPICMPTDTDIDTETEKRDI